MKRPTRLSPWNDRDTSLDVRNFTLDRMRDLGFISREQCAAVRYQQNVVGRRQNAQGHTYAVDYIRQQVIAAVGWDGAITQDYCTQPTRHVNSESTSEAALKARWHKRE